MAKASEEARTTGQGVAILIPPGNYRITKKITISQSRVVLKGSGVSCWGGGLGNCSCLFQQWSA